MVRQVISPDSLKQIDEAVIEPANTGERKLRELKNGKTNLMAGQ